MFAAVNSRPSMATPGSPTPTGMSAGMPSDFTSRRMSRPIVAPTLLRRRWRRRRDAQALGHEEPGPRVDHRGLDAAPADVDADGVGAGGAVGCGLATGLSVTSHLRSS